MRANSKQKARPTTILAIAIAAVGVFAGDAGMLGVVALARSLSTGVYLQWAISVVVIALGSYLFFGLTQIKAWEKDQIDPRGSDDFRTRWSLRLLGHKNNVAFVLASLIGGPLAVGYAAGYTHDVHGRQKTFIAAWIMAAFWAAVYLGAVYAIVKLIH
jgi:hypothetical protein